MDVDFTSTCFPCLEIDYESSEWGRFYIIDETLWFRQYDACSQKEESAPELVEGMSMMLKMYGVDPI